MRKTILSLIILCWIWKASAQEDPAKKDTWQFSLSSGVSTPLGSFARHDAADAMIFGSPPDTYTIIGINKLKDGFARTGYYYGLTIDYSTQSGVLFQLKGGQNINSQRTAEVEDYIRNYYSITTSFQFDADQYKVGYLLPGIGYGFSLKKWQIETVISGGMAQSSYPSFTTNTYVVNSSWQPEKPWPNLKAFAWGYSLDICRSLGKHVFTRVNISYLQADFKYNMTTELSPIGISNPQYQDTIKWKVLQTGLSLGYRW